MGCDYPDGSRRLRHDELPLAALAKGPVWVLDEVSGCPRLAARRAAVATRNGSSVVVLYDDEAVLAVLPMDCVSFCETVTVIDPDGRDRFGRQLWCDLAAGTELTFLWTEAGDFD